MAGFLTVVNGLPNSGTNGIAMPSRAKSSRLTGPFPRTEPPKSTNLTPNRKKSGLVSLEDVMREKQMERQRPSTPSTLSAIPSTPPRPSKKANTSATGDVMSTIDSGMTIEVKPLPKIRLSLMPAPREEDEEDVSSASQPTTPVVRKKKKSTSFRRSNSTAQKKLPVTM